MTNDSGLVVRVGDRVVGGSVAGRLNALGERLRTAVEEQRSPAMEFQEPDEQVVIGHKYLSW